MRGLWDLKSVARLVAKVKASRADVIHAHMHNAFWAAQAVGWLAQGSRIVYTIQKEGQRAGWLELRIDRALMRGVAVVASSEGVRESYLRLGARPRDFRVIHNCIDFSKFRERVNLVEGELGLTGVPIIGTVGRLLPVKGHRYLLEALPAVLKQHPRTRCVIVGDGPEREALQALARDLGVAEAVTWTGARKDIQNFVPYFDVFAMPSLSEAFGIAAAEAAACGVPVVASAVGGLPEVIQDGLTGFLVPSQDPAALAAKIGLLLSDRSLRERMGSLAERSVERFSSTVLSGQWDEVYSAK